MNKDKEFRFVMFVRRKRWRRRYHSPERGYLGDRMTTPDKVTPFGTYYYVIGDEDWDTVSAVRKNWNAEYGRTRYQRRVK